MLCSEDTLVETLMLVNPMEKNYFLKDLNNNITLKELLYIDNELNEYFSSIIIEEM